jgi:hypothetical protein
LEVLLGFLLIAIAAVAIGGRIGENIRGYRFRSDLKRLSSELKTFRQLAMHTQSDMRVCLRKEKNGWVLEGICVEQPETFHFSSLHLGNFELTVDRKNIPLMMFDFFSTGEIYPHATLFFCMDGDELSPLNEAWEIPRIFHWVEKESIETFING